MAVDGEPELISGGQLVAEALKAEGADVISTPRGGHIIDSYDGCMDVWVNPPNTFDSNGGTRGRNLDN
ncbi:MAG TPA: hypothetical protein VFG87_30660 [Amycolatopsis sp.]|jgi:hypothetical protein|nr:hypothetical protein [Amycolatopsis sp.]